MKIHERSHPYPESRQYYSDMKNIDGIIDRAVLSMKDEIQNYVVKCHRFVENDKQERENDGNKDYELSRTVTNEGT